MLCREIHIYIHIICIMYLEVTPCRDCKGIRFGQTYWNFFSLAYRRPARFKKQLNRFLVSLRFVLPSAISLFYCSWNFWKLVFKIAKETNTVFKIFAHRMENLNINIAYRRVPPSYSVRAWEVTQNSV